LQLKKRNCYKKSRIPLHHNATNCEENLSDVGLRTGLDPLLDVWLDDDVIGEGGQVSRMFSPILSFRPDNKWATAMSAQVN
jgi:hypothetical protein